MVTGVRPVCELCTSHCRIGGELHCLDLLVCGPLTSVPCDQARSRDGGCGWEALRLDWPAIGVRSGSTPAARVIPLQEAA